MAVILPSHPKLSAHSGSNFAQFAHLRAAAESRESASKYASIGICENWCDTKSVSEHRDRRCNFGSKSWSKVQFGSKSGVKAEFSRGLQARSRLQPTFRQDCQTLIPHLAAPRYPLARQWLRKCLLSLYFYSFTEFGFV